MGAAVIVIFSWGNLFSQTHPLSEVYSEYTSGNIFISKNGHNLNENFFSSTPLQSIIYHQPKTNSVVSSYVINQSNKDFIASTTKINSLLIQHGPRFYNTDQTDQRSISIQFATEGTITSVSTGGLWSDPASWVGGVVPGAGDDVIIANGTSVTVDANITCLSISIESGATLTVNNAVTLQVTTDWNNDGTFTAGTSGTVEFSGTSNSTITGTTTFEELIINKGNLSSTLNINGNTTVSSGGSLTLNSGLIQINSGGSFDLNFSNQLDIPNIAGFNINGGTLNTGNFTIYNEGLIQISSGTANFGTQSGNSVHTQIDGVFEVSGGNVTIAGRLENTAGGTLNPPGIPSGINISGGTVTLGTVGNGLSSTGTLNVTANGDFNFTGGRIIFQNASTATTALDLGFVAGAGSKTITSGIFQFGSSSTSSSNTFVINSEIPIPNIETYSNIDLTLNNSLIITDQLTLGSNSHLNLNGNTLQKPVSATGSYSFPLVDNSGNSIPLTVQITAGSFTSGAYIELSTTDSKHTSNTNTTNYLNRFWTISTSGITGLSYNVNASFSNIDKVGNTSGFIVGDYSGSNWSQISGASFSSNSLSITNATSDLEFTALSEPVVSITADKTVVCSGSPANLTANATGDPLLTYSWSSNPSGYSSSNSAVTVNPNKQRPSIQLLLQTGMDLRHPTILTSQSTRFPM